MQSLQCTACNQSFQVLDQEIEFSKTISPVIGGKKFDLPLPRFCPTCRQQHRLAYRNEQYLYPRTCDLCKKNIISVYPAESVYTVYCRDCWWGDGWDGLSFGKDFDFNRPFFEQFDDLQKSVPRLSVNNVKDQNSEYSNYCYGNKDCYLMYTSDLDERCFHGCFVWQSFDCVDNLFLWNCELCYECVDCLRCYACSYCQECEACTDCFACFDLKSCRDCFGSSGLRNKEYYFFNQACSKEEYEAKVAAAKADWPALMERLKTVGTDTPRRNLFILQCENALGDHLKNSKNIYMCFDCNELEEGAYCSNMVVASDHCYDMDGGGIISWAYEALSTGDSSSYCIGTDHNWNANSYMIYASYCMGSSDIFACCGLKRRSYCILNKEYPKDEYEALLPRIIEHMQKTGEWGLFFPPAFSLFPYNETAAQLYYPLTKEQALAKAYRWNDTVLTDYSGKPFNIIAQEKAFYQKRGLPEPTEHPKVRFMRRFKKRNPRTLWSRNCDQCGNSMYSSYAPERSETVYCESCYLKTVY